ncbi:MAG: hypothetical protein AB1640_10610 [bacterium]
MKDGGRSPVEEQIEQLERLRQALFAERKSLAAMDREALVEASREKERIVALLGESISRARAGATTDGKPPARPDAREAELLRNRDRLARDLLEQCRVHEKALEEQKDQVSRSLAFVRSLRPQSPVYDRAGRLR